MPLTRPKAPRGRPRSASRPATAKRDEIIARTAEQLSLWGFSLSSVYAALAKAGAGLGAEAIKKVHSKWRRIPFKERSGLLMRGSASRYTKTSLQRARPNDKKGRPRRLSDLVAELLANGGRLTPEPTEWLVPPMLPGEMDAEGVPEVSRPFLARGIPRGSPVWPEEFELTPHAATVAARWRLMPRFGGRRLDEDPATDAES